MIVLVVELMIALAAAVVAVALIARVAWEWGFRGLPAPVKRWAKVQRLAAWADIHSTNTQTPLEATRELAAVVSEPAALGRLARAFTAARYSAAGVEETDEQATERNADYRQVQRRLWSLAVRRALRLRRRGRGSTGSALRGTPAARR